MSGTAGAAGGPRLLVPDVLRGGAILAMLVAHAVPFLPEAPDVVRLLMRQVNDVASPLFALVMGMSAQLVAERTDRSRRARMLAQQVVRGLLLIALGVWMEGWHTWVAIVLGQLGILLIVGAPLVLLPTRWLVAVAASCAVLAAPVNAWARSELLWAFADPEAPFSRVAGWVALSAHYRLTNLLPFFLLGALLLRHGFRRDVLLWTVLAVAPLAYLVVPVLLRLRPEADVSSGSLPDTLHDLGLVLGAYAVTVLVVTVRGARAMRVVGVVTVPLLAAGAVSLSLYLLHVGVLALWAPGGPRPAENDLLGWLVIVPGTMAAGFLWWRLVGTGPAEWLVGALTARRKPRRTHAGPVPRLRG
ncbi:heparan-alpha-glucosaminide N-acetyltransferase domain-containing protein [Oryzobacter telluris]|uniref:heparan-alpha-glucosaminide N-acetyltransferase domain-containing protein n=1 Tax=Oryzobacter telluris TaxID=3149179 RepID=UPI00370D3580